MAAYASLVSLAQVLERILYPQQQCDVVDHNKEQIKQLHENIVFLLTFLDDFSGEEGNLEAQITTSTNQAEDIIECHISDEILSESGTHNCNLSHPSAERAGHQIVLYAGLKHHNWRSLYRKLHKSIKEIDSILKEVIQIKSSKSTDLRPNNSSGSSSSSSSSSQRLEPKGNDIVVGFQEDLMKIKDRLCGDKSSKLQIIPIVGMGGIGKTTLARYAYDDPLIVHHFYFRAWVTVSQDYDGRRILLGLLYSIDASKKEKHEEMEDEKLKEHVYRYLKGRRYLIVMDDMWNTNVWDDVRRIFPNDFNGSRVIITTRELDVASYADSSSNLYQMRLMDVDQSWTLLREKVFKQEDCPPELEKIGQLIAENCRGLPLAIVVIAGVLSKVNPIRDTWEDIARNVIKAVNTSDEQVLEILSLSYTHLPLHLRPCFLYMGGFPEDQEIKASKLIKCWVAEGFLKSNGSKDLEEVAEECLEELAKRSLILVIKKRSDCKIKAVKIHDLLRDLCLRKAQDENFLLVPNDFSSSSRRDFLNSRRLSISNTWCGLLEVYGSATRTILVFSRRFRISQKCWKCFRLLRILDAVGVILISFPSAISKLFHLRYLALSFIHMDNSKFEVPGSLSELQNLQTLILGGSNLSLPLGIWRMPRLRHLIFSKGFLPDLYDPNVLALENLHTLSGVTCFTWSLRIFKMIPNLKKLAIIYSSEDLKETGWSEYCLENLVHLRKLEKLKFRTVPYGQGSLFESIAFPRTLKKLTLVNRGIKWKDMQIVGSLPNLEVLKLKQYACRGSKWETTEGEFCQLKLLLIDGAGLSQWITESDHFPILQRLVLYNCHNLRQIPRGIGEIPTLQLIEVDLRNLSVVESAKYIEEEQRSFGNDDLQVHLLKSRHWSK